MGDRDPQAITKLELEDPQATRSSSYGIEAMFLEPNLHVKDPKQF